MMLIFARHPEHLNPLFAPLCKELKNTPLDRRSSAGFWRRYCVQRYTYTIHQSHKLLTKLRVRSLLLPPPYGVIIRYNQGPPRCSGRLPEEASGTISDSASFPLETVSFGGTVLGVSYLGALEPPPSYRRWLTGKEQDHADTPCTVGV